MASDLRNKTNSAFVAVSSLTRSKKSKPKIYVYVEDDLDKVFWRSMLSSLASDYHLILQVYHVGDAEVRGKDAMMKAAFERRIPVGERLLICIDADYDLLIDEYHPYTAYLRKCPYIITTEWYSMENLKCHPSKVIDFFDKMTLMEEIKLDFENSLRQVSVLYWQLLVMLLVSISNGDCYYEICHFGNDLKNISFDEKGTVDNATKIAVRAIVVKHNAYLAEHKGDIVSMEKKLFARGYNSENCWEIMKGHDLAEIIVKRLLMATAGPYIDARLQAIGNMGAPKQFKQDLCNSYKKEVGVNNQSKDERIMQLINDCTNLNDLTVSNIIMNNVQGAISKGIIARIVDGLIASRVG